MKLFWHVGLHKTGTTSLQQGLAAHAASGKASYYYPPTSDFGPGHAELAWQFLGLNGRTKAPGAVMAEVERAASLGFTNVVLSSEEFSRALMTDESFEPFGRVSEKVEVELVMTIRPLPSRIYPELQEMIKNGQRLQLSSVPELTDVVMNRPGLRPDFLPAAILGTKAAAVSVILVDTEEPRKLFEGMSTILGEKIPLPRNPLANVSYSFIKTAWLEVLNRYGGILPREARAAVEVAFAAASREVGRLPEVPYPPLPPVLKRYVDGVWALQLAYLRALQEGGSIRCL